jgi:hypothetical protein
MLLTNRLFTRREPEKEAKSLYVFCEGKKREYQYFKYFEGIDSRVNIVVYPLRGNEDNSPTGLYDLAIQCFFKSGDKPAPKYELLPGDEVWFVIDTDAWGEKVAQLRTNCNQHTDWYIAQSNPCFEVWLYFHLFEQPAIFEWAETCETWRAFLSQNVTGGFNSKKHPILIADAIERANNAFDSEDGMPAVGSTEVFRLGKTIYGFCKWKIEWFLNRL